MRSYIFKTLVIAAVVLSVFFVIKPITPSHAMTGEQLSQAIAGDSIKQGMDLFRIKKFGEALGHFQAAAKADRKNAGAWLMVGMTLNRLNKHQAAFIALNKSSSLGMKAPQIDFEIGWAALKSAAWQKAIDHLTTYEKNKPGNAKASEFLGRAYFRLQKYDEAEKYLKQAIKRDPSVKPTATLYLSRIKIAKGKRKEGGQMALDILRDSPNSPLSKTMRESMYRRMAVERLLRKKKRGKPRKPWFVALSVSGGHNDNVIGLPEGAVVPSDISAKASNFARTTLNAGYAWRLDNISQVIAGYGFYADTYADIDGFDSQNHSIYAEYQRRLRNNLIGAFRISGEYQLTGLDATRNQIGFRPSVNYRWNKQHSTEASYTIGINNYYATIVNQVLDRDSLLHTLGFRHSIRKMSRLDIDTTIGYYYSGNDADGADYDYDANTFLLSMSRDFPWKIRVGFNFTHALTRYDNPTSLSGAGFGYKRRDKMNNVSVGISRPVKVFDKTDVTVFGQFNYTDNDSNVPEFKYFQHSFNFGVSKRF